MDYKIALFEASIKKYVQDTDLPPTVKKMVLEKVLNEVGVEAAAALLEQKKEVESDAESIQSD